MQENVNRARAVDSDARPSKLNKGINASQRLVTMSAAQFARDECSNMLPDGACLGVHADSLIDTGQQRRCTPQPRCLVRDDRRCRYFEKVILPLADQPSPHADPHLQQKRAWARQEYLGRHCLAGSQGRRCPECGNPMPARHRFCESCSTRHRRTATKERVRRHRQVAVPV